MRPNRAVSPSWTITLSKTENRSWLLLNSFTSLVKMLPPIFTCMSGAASFMSFASVNPGINWLVLIIEIPTKPGLFSRTFGRVFFLK
jgi:hypothetical protein